jgi:hypothetical protein
MLKVVILATNHEIQEKDYNGTSEFRTVLDYLLRVWQVEIVMEEWTSSKGQTVGQRFAIDNSLRWFNVGTPSDAQFKTYIPLYDPMEEPPMVIHRYGPLEAHIKREDYMATRIQESMAGLNCGLFIVGLAHLHSMSERLLKSGFEVEGFSWTTPPLILE